MTGCLLPRFKKQPHPHELREPLEEIETVIAFLRNSGRPRQMTFDRDPRLSSEG